MKPKAQDGSKPKAGFPTSKPLARTAVLCTAYAKKANELAEKAQSIAKKAKKRSLHAEKAEAAAVAAIQNIDAAAADSLQALKDAEAEKEVKKALDIMEAQYPSSSSSGSSSSKAPPGYVPLEDVVKYIIEKNKLQKQAATEALGEEAEKPMIKATPPQEPPPARLMTKATPPQEPPPTRLMTKAAPPQKPPPPQLLEDKTTRGVFICFIEL